MRLHLYLPPPLSMTGPNCHLPSKEDKLVSPEANNEAVMNVSHFRWETASKRFQGDTLAFIRVVSVSVQEFKNVFRKSLCFRFSAKVQLTLWLESSDGTETNFNYSTRRRNWNSHATDILFLSNENPVSQKSRLFTRSGKITSSLYR